MPPNTSYVPQPPEEPGRPVVMGQGGRQPEKPKKEGWRSVAATVAILLTAPLVAFLLTLFVFQSYQVDGPSMQPTLQDGDRLIVWKLPRTWAKLTGQNYQPNRGDVIIFTEPKIIEWGQAADKQLIKRVIALPGERVVTKDGTITVYSNEHPEGFKPDDLLPYGKTLAATNHDGEWEVGDGELFVSGDNRPESLDSRYFGPIQQKNIIGKLSYRVLPITEVKGF